MNSSPEHMSIEFHKRANELFFALIRDFQSAVMKIDRKQDEYSFLQLQEQYVNTCHGQMEAIAKEIIFNNRHHSQVNQADQNLRHFTQDYLHQFVQKIKSM